MNVFVTESQLKFLTEKLHQRKLEEGVFDSIGNVMQGLKGVWRGEGYDYFKQVSALKNVAKRLKKLDEPNRDIMIELSGLKTKISSSKMPQNKKQNLVNAIDQAINHFQTYSNYIDAIERATSQKLS